MNVTHLRHLAIVTPDVAGSRAFFAHAWGLRALPQSGDGAAYFATRSAERFQLVLLPGERRRIERIAFGLPSRADVDAAARELAAAGVEIVAAPFELTTPGGGYGLRFRDPDGRCIELSADVADGDVGAGAAVPLKLAHVVVNTTDIDRSTAFYEDVLGFRVSDWSEHQMSFLRCDSEHHALAFNAAPHVSYNHSSWTMASIDELFRAQGRVRAAGTPLAWGTGRHGPGAQVFNYYVEPSGYVVELIADGIDIARDDEWVPTVWERRPEAMDLWGTAGPPSAELRAAMSGTPETDFAERV